MLWAVAGGTCSPWWCGTAVIPAVVVSWGYTQQQGKYLACITAVCFIHNLCH